MFDCCRFSSHWAFGIAADLTILLVVGIPVVIFYVAREPFKTGFFCSDDSLRYSYRELTVPTWALYFFGFVLPIATIFITECLMKKLCETRRQRIGSWPFETYNHAFVFNFGAGCTQLLTDMIKYTIGRLRPHFFDVCIPNVDCNDPRIKNAYVENFECRGNDVYLLKDARLSFPRAHSSISAYSMVFLVIYCSSKLTCTGSNRVRHVLQYFAIVLAGLTPCTLAALMTVLFVSELFTCGRRGDVGATVSRPEDVAFAEPLEAAHRKYTVI